MRMESMKWVDAYVGVTICFILSMILSSYRILTLKAFRNKKDPLVNLKFKNILFIKFFGIGSIILLSPVVKAVKNKYPDAKIFFLTFSSNKEICEILDISDINVYIRRNNIFVFIIDVIKTSIKFNMVKIDIACDFEFFARFTVIMLVLSGAKVRIGFYLRKVWRGNLILTHQVYFNHFRHVSRTFSALVSPLGIDEDSIGRPQINVDSNSVRDLVEILPTHNESNEQGKKLVCVNVNSSELSTDRRWPKEKFAELSDRLLKCSRNLLLIFIGSLPEREYVQSVISMITNHEGRILNLSGEINLKELVIILKESEMLITCDSGPMHIASAIQVPTVSLFGPETPVRYGPEGGKHIVFCKDIYCSPCLNVYNAKTSMCNGGNECMHLISVDEVFKEISCSFPHLFDTKK